jgi:hypothetical protein
MALAMSAAEIFAKALPVFSASQLCTSGEWPASPLWALILAMMRWSRLARAET